MMNNLAQMLINTMIQQNPAVKQALPFIQGKNPQQLEMIARNLCKERGINVEDALKQAQAMMRNMNMK